MIDERIDRETDATHLHPEEPASINRRGLLASAASGFALAASGLLLPDWLIEEAEADNHPVRRIQGRKEHKREKRGKELERNRHQQRKEHQNQNTAPTSQASSSCKEQGQLMRITIANAWPVPGPVKGFNYDCQHGYYVAPSAWALTYIPSNQGKTYGHPADTELTKDAAFQFGSGTAIRFQTHDGALPTVEEWDTQWRGSSPSGSAKLVWRGQLANDESIKRSFFKYPSETKDLFYWIYRLDQGYGVVHFDLRVTEF